MKENPTRRRYLNLPHGRLCPPLFMPDATFGVVRSVDSDDLLSCRIQAVVMNVFHLMQNPGSSVIRESGGLHKFFGWNHPIVTDSGGFQAYSMIRQNPKFGSVTNKGMLFRPEGSTRKFLLTPEKSIQLQLSYGSDLVICLDDCTHVNEPFQSQQESVYRTIEWAKRCKHEFERRTRQTHACEEPKPLLFAVVQGGGGLELRKECAKSLLEIGFDGFGYGGYPLDNKGNLLTNMIRFTRELIPTEFPMIALGVGEPGNVFECVKMGYDLFDSSMPTRDARQGRLYAFERGLQNQSQLRRGVEYSYLYIQDKKHVKTKGPVSPYCDCLACSSSSLAYLHHLWRMKDSLYSRLATIHNLRFMTLLMEHLEGDSDENGCAKRER